MKTRTGFVSNSSTSSFIISVRPENKVSDIDIFLRSKLEIDKGHPLCGIVDKVVECILDACSKGISSVEEYADHSGYSVEETKEWCSDVCKFLDDGWTVYEGSFSSESSGNPIESMLCETDLNFGSEEEGIIMKHEGGY